jgi:ABC-type transport system substrate-binding protein
MDVHSFAVPAHGGFIPPSLLGHAHDAGMPHDPDVARRLLDGAGYPGGAGLPPLRLLVSVEWTTALRTFDNLADMWADVGVTMEQHAVPHSESFDLRSDVDAWVPSWIADFPDPEGMLGSVLTFYPFLCPPGSTSAALLAQARRATSRAQRIDLYRRLDRVLVHDEVRLIPFGYASRRFLVRPSVQGFWATPLRCANPDELMLGPGSAQPGG